MKIALSLLALLVIGANAASVVSDSNSVEQEEEDGFVSTVKHEKGKDVVELKDKDGNLEFSSEVFLDQDIEVDKPAGRNVCLIRQTSTNATCFVETAVTEKLPEEIQESCEGSEIIKLEPESCDNEQSDTEGEEQSRDRRGTTSTCCRYNCWTSRVCTATRCCCSFFGICLNRCCSCYSNRRECSRKCVTGSTSRY